jgi:hypothetical protein
VKRESSGSVAGSTTHAKGSTLLLVSLRGIERDLLDRGTRGTHAARSGDAEGARGASGDTERRTGFGLESHRHQGTRGAGGRLSRTPGDPAQVAAGNLVLNAVSSGGCRSRPILLKVPYSRGAYFMFESRITHGETPRKAMDPQ